MSNSSGTRRLSRALSCALAAVLLTLTAPLESAHAATTCTTPAVSNYHVDGNGQLRRWSHSGPLTGSATWYQSVIDPTWGGITTFSGGDGVLFTISGSGALRWHKDNNYNGTGGPSWHPNSGATIGSGWSGFSRVMGGGDGTIYAVAPDGKLYWYRYLGTAGEVNWVSSQGRLIGTGWGGFQRIAPSGKGVLYGVTSGGDLRWYRHLDPLGGNPTWANGGTGTTVGIGWAGFTRLASFGAGILLARNSTGTLFWYRHLDPLGGSFNWANDGEGTSQGTGWNNSQILADVTGCRET
ncbi:hypothetical protein FGD71_032035 [Streptomyces sporangiiformans]|uniref:Tachylectin 2 domain-containing protein n=1 Tax=Streptomyces sporangiiformans TaxID=2315329 RepID=A0A505DGL2_9ACTN|nr:hypothetical protein FGD71_032035 [Streptomyces sporangiiformans]